MIEINLYEWELVYDKIKITFKETTCNGVC